MLCLSNNTSCEFFPLWDNTRKIWKFTLQIQYFDTNLQTPCREQISWWKTHLNKTSTQWTPGRKIYLGSKTIIFWSMMIFEQKEFKKMHKSCIIYAWLFLQQTPSSLIRCTLPYSSFIWYCRLNPLRFFEQR